MSTTNAAANPSGIRRKSASERRLHWRRALLATTAALSLGAQNAYALCSDGSTLPADGFVIGRDPQVLTAANWSANVFTAAAGSIFIPDTSVNEANDPLKPLTKGGHSWVFDQGSTLCKETDVGGGNAVATGWTIPPNTATDCVILPIIKNGRVTNLGDIPYQGQAITPTCNPALLNTVADPSNAKGNTYFNQLGCSISHGIANTPATATTYLFVAGIKGGLFSIAMNNVANPKLGGDAGKVNGPQNYYANIPEGSKLTNAAVSPDGQFAVATSIRRAQFAYACFNPLGDPGDITKPINPGFFVPAGINSKCQQVGTNNLATDLTTAFGPDNQPYFGGQRIVNSFPAWPTCIYTGPGLIKPYQTLANAFNDGGYLKNTVGGLGGCGPAQPNFGFSSALVTQPSALISHVAANGDKYMYTGPLGGTVDQFKLTVDPLSGQTQYNFRTILTGVSLTSGLGVADDLQSLMVFTDPSAVGLAGQGVVTKLPLCEDM